uniref:Uncharacterized protein n=1 Tax=Anguilla anguilla TaxID=7936 RepID=A0A0E9PJ62_ANGAN
MWDPTKLNFPFLWEAPCLLWGVPTPPHQPPLNLSPETV